VTINNEIAVTGNRVNSGDVVQIDGEPIRKAQKALYIAFNKPTGVTSTTDNKDKTNIIDFIGYPQRIFPIGRLDKDSEGLIFLTNDGNIVNKMLRAGNNHEKEYVVTVDKPINHEFINAMSNGVPVLGQMTRPCKVVQEGKSTFRITLTQGLNRQIRRMCEYLGYEVKRLRRVRIMNVHIGDLPIGNWRYLTNAEIEMIMKLVADSKGTEEASVVISRPVPRKRKDISEDKPKAIKTKNSTPKKSSFKGYRTRGKKQ